MHVKRLGKYAVSSLWVTIITAALCYLCYFLFDLTFLGSFSGRSDESDVVNFFYSIENRSAHNIRGDMDILILDISTCSTLTEIADAIKAAAACEPEIMGIDIIFRQTPTVDPAEYDYLEAAIASVPRLVTACRAVKHQAEASGYMIEHSFYTQKLGIPHGATNNDFGEYKPRIIAGNDTLPLLSSLLVRGAMPGKGRYVNYSNKYFDVIRAGEAFTDADFRGKTVIVGDVEDLRDYHDLPFRLNGSRRLSGAVLLAYAVSTAGNGDWIRKMPAVWCILIALAFTYAFTVGSFYLGRPGIKYRSLKNRLLRIGVIVLLFFIGYWIFTSGGVVVNLVYAMLGVALTGLSMDVLALIKDMREKSGNMKKRKKGAKKLKIVRNENR